MGSIVWVVAFPCLLAVGTALLTGRLVSNRIKRDSLLLAEEIARAAKDDSCDACSFSERLDSLGLADHELLAPLLAALTHYFEKSIDKMTQLTCELKAANTAVALSRTTMHTVRVSCAGLQTAANELHRSSEACQPRVVRHVVEMIAALGRQCEGAIRGTDTELLPTPDAMLGRAQVPLELLHGEIPDPLWSQIEQLVAPLFQEQFGEFQTGTSITEHLDIHGIISRFGSRARRIKLVYSALAESYTQIRPTLDHAFATRDYDELNRAGHALKGLFLEVGFVRAAELSAQLENITIASRNAEAEISQWVSLEKISILIEKYAEVGDKIAVQFNEALNG